MRHRLRYSIQSGILLALSLITVGITVCSVFISYQHTLREMRGVSVDYTSQLINQVNGDINRYVGYMEDVSEVVGKNETVHRWLNEGHNLGLSERMVLEDALTNQMTSIINIRSDITNIGVFALDGRVVFDARGKQLNNHAEYETTEWYTQAIARAGGTYVSTSHVQNVVDGQYKWVVSISKAITTGSGEVTGVLLVDLNYSLINDLCAGIDLGDRGYVFLLDRDGNIIYHPQQQLIYAGIKSEEAGDLVGLTVQRATNSADGDKLYLSNHSSVTGWTMIGVAFQDELLSNSGQIVQFYTILLVAFILVSLVLSFLISAAISGPLRRLSASMKEAETGNLATTIEVSGPTEVEQLGESFNTMLARLDELMRQRESDQKQKRKSELMALQAQINPHFLYNTLDSIIWMAESERHEEVVEMTAALARLFRSSISEPRELVPLTVELANVISYLTIQKMRYKEKLRFSMDISPAVEGYMLPKLLLQPLVENAIYHGIKPRGSGGEVQLRAWANDEYMYVEVSDDGVGMDNEHLNGVLDAKPNHTSGIGVRNVHDRIRLVYGEGYGLQISSTEGRGTVVRVVLPVKGVEE